MNYRSTRINHLLLAAATLSIALFILYAGMLPNDITAANNSADGGDYLAAILTDGVPHPSGYPTYLLVGKLFQLLPMGSPYLRQAIASAIFAALAAGLVAFLSGLICHKGKSPGGLLSALVSGGIMGVAPLYWSQAVIVEVHGLHSFFMACFLLWVTLLCQDYASNAASDIFISSLSILIGFGAGNHITILLAFPIIPFALYVGWRKGVRIELILKYGLLICLIAIGVYMYLPFLARNNPPVNWGNSQSLQGFLGLVSGEIYQGLLFSMKPAEYFQRISAWAKLLLHQFGFLGLLFGVIGVFRFQEENRAYKWFYLWIFVVYTLFSIGYRTNDSTNYLIPSIMIFSIWIGWAVNTIVEKPSMNFSWEGFLLAAAVLVLLFRIPGIRSENDPRTDLSAKRFVENCISSLPMEAIVITSADLDTFSLWYYHFGLGYREDISIVTRGLMQYDWYHQNLSYTYPTLIVPDSVVENIDAVIGQMNPGRPVCVTHIDKSGFDDACSCGK